MFIGNTFLAMKHSWTDLGFFYIHYVYHLLLQTEENLFFKVKMRPSVVIKKQLKAVKCKNLLLEGFHDCVDIT